MQTFAFLLLLSAVFAVCFSAPAKRVVAGDKNSLLIQQQLAKIEQETLKELGEEVFPDIYNYLWNAFGSDASAKIEQDTLKELGAKALPRVYNYLWNRFGPKASAQLASTHPFFNPRPFLPHIPHYYPGKGTGPRNAGEASAQLSTLPFLPYIPHYYPGEGTGPRKAGEASAQLSTLPPSFLDYFLRSLGEGTGPGNAGEIGDEGTGSEAAGGEEAKEQQFFTAAAILGPLLYDAFKG